MRDEASTISKAYRDVSDDAPAISDFKGLFSSSEGLFNRDLSNMASVDLDSEGPYSDSDGGAWAYCRDVNDEASAILDFTGLLGGGDCAARAYRDVSNAASAISDFMSVLSDSDCGAGAYPSDGENEASAISRLKEFFSDGDGGARAYRDLSNEASAILDSEGLLGGSRGVIAT